MRGDGRRKPNNIIISTGSGEILTAAVMAYCNGDKSLVTGDPSYGSPAQTAQRIKAPVKFIAVNPKTLALDLEGMIAPLSAPALCSSAIRTTRRRPCKRLRTSSRWCAPSSSARRRPAS